MLLDNADQNWFASQKTLYKNKTKMRYNPADIRNHKHSHCQVDSKI